jgi:hypothetical protein
VAHSESTPSEVTTSTGGESGCVLRCKCSYSWPSCSRGKYILGACTGVVGRGSRVRRVWHQGYGVFRRVDCRPACKCLVLVAFKAFSSRQIDSLIGGIRE